MTRPRALPCPARLAASLAATESERSAMNARRRVRAWLLRDVLVSSESHDAFSVSLILFPSASRDRGLLVPVTV